MTELEALDELSLNFAKEVSKYFTNHNLTILITPKTAGEGAVVSRASKEHLLDILDLTHKAVSNNQIIKINNS